jgi:integrase
LALWRLLLDSGMRIGEAVALKWTDIDGNRVRVERTQSSVGGQLVVGTPKTAASRRTIPLEPETIAALRRHELAQKEERMRLGLRDTAGWVFTVRGHGLGRGDAALAGQGHRAGGGIAHHAARVAPHHDRALVAVGHRREGGLEKAGAQ